MKSENLAKDYCQQISQLKEPVHSTVYNNELFASNESFLHLTDDQQLTDSNSYNSFSGTFNIKDTKLEMLKNDLHGCTFIDQNGIKCDEKGHSSNIAFKSHRVSKNCPNMLKQDLNEKHSKQMIIDEVECQRMDCRTLHNQVNDLRQQLLNEQNQNVYKLVRILYVFFKQLVNCVKTEDLFWFHHILFKLHLPHYLVYFLKNFRNDKKKG